VAGVRAVQSVCTEMVRAIMHVTGKYLKVFLAQGDRRISAIEMYTVLFPEE
jgi:hypothetical protein